MQAMYLGGPSRKGGLLMFDVWFPLDEWTDVDPESKLAQKLRGHPHFAVQAGDPQEDEKARLREILEEAGEAAHHKCGLASLREKVDKLNANKA